MKKRINLLIVISFFPFFALGQIFNPVKWSFSTNEINEREIELHFKATIDPEWHIYSHDISEDAGPYPTTIHFDNQEGFEFVGEIRTIPEKPIIKFDKSFNAELKYFSEHVDFIRTIRLTKNSPVEIKGYVEFMSCNDETCTPPADEAFSFQLNQQSGTNALTTSTSSPEESHSMLAFFLISFLAGLAALLTPCVFPMVPMTVSYFMHQSESNVKAKFEAFTFGLSIIGIYTLIGTLVTVTLGPNFANWLSTHWFPNLLFFIIFTLFAFSFFGMFEITLPSWMVNKSDKQVDKGGIMGPFFMALTLVLVSFSCTGPIVGAILVESAGGQIMKPIGGMFGFSLAFALPFTLFALFPHWLSHLPKSGGWLNSVKVVLGYLELALGLKFLSIADQTYHWGLLDREVYLAIWIVIFLLLGFYLLGKLKFAHDSEVAFVTVPRLMLAILSFSFVVYLIPGLVGAPLKGISGYLPPQTTHDFDLHHIIRDEVRSMKTSPSLASTEIIPRNECEKPKYSEKLHLPHGLQGYFDYEQGLACAKAQNKPIFIDFTGHGCVNCREMEASVWSDTRVLDLLENEFVIIALYVDDKQKLPESDWVTSTYDGKVKKTLGKKYADFQITRFGVNAQPYYVLLDYDETMLAEPKSYNLNPDHFIEFLNKGLKKFSEKHLN